MALQTSILQLRKNLEENLRDWIPDNDNLRNKELALFDKLLTRRDFLKCTSLATLAVFVNGCSGGAPSQWDEFDDEPTLIDIEEIEMASVSTPANMIVDSDVMTSAISYNPLGALGSDDALHVKDNAVMESFNPHIMTADTYDFGENSGFIEPDRTYGIPEYVHLSKESESTDYYLDIYEKSTTGHHGLVETKVSLEGTASLTFNTLIATNGSFHNKVSGSTAYSQKMALLANVGPSIAYGDSASIPLRLYYQSESSALLEPGVEPSISFDWKHIDLMKRFKANETHLFSSYEIIETDTYHDGANQNFIYGTIRFDSLYNYGFIVAFNAFSDGEPIVTFFAPEFLSYKADTVENLVDGFTSAAHYTHDALESFAIFARQTFRPLTQLVDADGKTASQAIFSFVSYDIAAGSTDGRLHPTGAYFNLDRFFTLDKTFIKRYVMTVETSQGGVIYGLGGYAPTASITADANTFTLVFDTGSIPSVDIWHDLYSQNSYQLAHTFVRSLKNEGGAVNILMATSFYDQTDLGVSQKSLTLDMDPTSGDLSNLTVQTADTLFDSSEHEGASYQDLWFNDMKGHLNSYDTLADCVLHDNGILDFYCTHNHQGLLRSYYIVRYVNSDGSVNSFLVGFNEQGTVPTSNWDEVTIAYQDHDTLKEQIINNTALHHPPMPVAVNPCVMHPWHGVSNDGEVLYTATRTHLVDTVKKTLLPNDGTQGDFFSYAHASCDIVEKSWNVFEEQKQVAPEKAAEHMVSIDLHQLHLHATNIYGMNAKLNDDTFVEVRFNKKLIVKDYTDINTPKTYHVGPLSSIFLKPDASGKISLEVDAGNNDDKYHGAMLEYRFVSKQALSVQDGKPMADLTNIEGITTEFKQCNISFRMYDRLSTDQFDQVRPGAPTDIGTAQDALNANVKSEYLDAVPKFAQGYANLHEGARPNNDAPARSIRLTHAAVTKPDGMIALTASSASDTPKNALFFHFHIHFNPINWIRHAIKTIVHVVKEVVTEAEKALQKAAEAIKQAVIKLTKDIDAIITAIETTIVNAAQDIAAAVEKAWDAVTTFAEALWDWLKALFDLETAFKIGQEIKQLKYDQLKPIGYQGDESKGIYDASENPYQHNVYTCMSEIEDELTGEVHTFIDGVKENVDNGIDMVFGALNKTGTGDQTHFETSHQTGSAKQKDQKENSTSISYLFDQFNRAVSQFCSQLPLPDFSDSNPLGGALMLSFNDSNQTLFYDTYETMKDIVVSSSPVAASVITGGVSYPDAMVTLKHYTKSLVNLAAVNAGTIIDEVISFPTTFMQDDTLDPLSKRPKENDIFSNSILELTGLLFFFDTKKFKTPDDIMFSILGFGVHTMGLVFSGVPAGLNHSNLIDYITTQQFRNDYNRYSDEYLTFSTAGNVLTAAEGEEGWKWAVLVTDIIDGIAAVLLDLYQAATSLVKSEALKAILNWVQLFYKNILLFARELALITTLAHSIATFVHNRSKSDTESVGKMTAAGLEIAAVLSEFVKYLIETGKTVVDFFVMWSTLEGTLEDPGMALWKVLSKLVMIGTIVIEIIATIFSTLAVITELVFEFITSIEEIDWVEFGFSLTQLVLGWFKVFVRVIIEIAEYVETWVEADPKVEAAVKVVLVVSTAVYLIADVVVIGLKLTSDILDITTLQSSPVYAS